MQTCQIKWQLGEKLKLKKEKAKNVNVSPSQNKLVKDIKNAAGALVKSNFYSRKILNTCVSNTE